MQGVVEHQTVPEVTKVVVYLAPDVPHVDVDYLKTTIKESLNVVELSVLTVISSVTDGMTRNARNTTQTRDLAMTLPVLKLRGAREVVPNRDTAMSLQLATAIQRHGYTIQPLVTTCPLI